MARADALSYLAERIRKLAADDEPNGCTEHHQIARELDHLASTSNDYVATLERDLKIAEDEWKRQLINCQVLKSTLLDLNSNAYSPTFVIRRTDEALDQISFTELSRRNEVDPVTLKDGTKVRLSEPQKLLLYRLPDLPSEGGRVKGPQKRAAQSLEAMGLIALLGGPAALGLDGSHYYTRTADGTAFVQSEKDRANG